MTRKMRRNLNDPEWKRNQYFECLQTVGKICENYDQSEKKKIPFLGFGSILPGGRTDYVDKTLPTTDWTSHCFAMNGNILDPYVDGVQGLLETYA